MCGRGSGAPGLVIWLQRTSLYGQALQWEAWAEGPAGPGLPGHPPGAVGLAPKAGQRGRPGALTGAGRQSARPQSGPPRVLSAESRGRQAQGRSWWRRRPCRRCPERFGARSVNANVRTRRVEPASLVRVRCRTGATRISGRWSELYFAKAVRRRFARAVSLAG